MSSLRTWTDLSIVLLSLECMVFLVIALAVGYFLVRVMNIVHIKAFSATRKAQEITRIVATTTNRVSEKVAEPMIVSHREATRAQSTMREFFNDGSHNKTTSTPKQEKNP